MTTDDNSLETLVTKIIQPYGYWRLMSCESANELAATLIAYAPHSYPIAARLPDLCRPENVALITIVLPWVAGYMATQDVPPYLDKYEVAERVTTLLRYLGEHPKYASYTSSINSIPDDLVGKLILEYLGLRDPDQRTQYIESHWPEIYSSAIDYMLASMAYAAHRDGEYRIRDADMQFRQELATARDSREYL